MFVILDNNPKALSEIAAEKTKDLNIPFGDLSTTSTPNNRLNKSLPANDKSGSKCNYSNFFETVDAVANIFF